MTIETKFDYMQRVWIRELSREGTVVGIFRDGDGVQYRVRYFWDGDAKSVYFFADELDVPPPRTLGYATPT